MHTLRQHNIQDESDFKYNNYKCNNYFYPITMHKKHDTCELFEMKQYNKVKKYHSHKHYRCTAMEFCNNSVVYEWINNVFTYNGSYIESSMFDTYVQKLFWST